MAYAAAVAKRKLISRSGSASKIKAPEKAKDDLAGQVGGTVELETVAATRAPMEVEEAGKEAESEAGEAVQRALAEVVLEVEAKLRL